MPVWRGCGNARPLRRDRRSNRRCARPSAAARSGRGLAGRQRADRHAAAGKRRRITGSRSRPAPATVTAMPGRSASTAGITIGVWVGRPDGAPVPGLVGRTAAAPILFDAFARTGKLPAAAAEAAEGRPLVASNAKLPLPLQRFRPRANWSGSVRSQAPRILFPPMARGSPSIAAMAARSRRCPSRSPAACCRSTVLVNGVSRREIDSRRQRLVEPPGSGLRPTDRDRRGGAARQRCA